MKIEQMSSTSLPPNLRTYHPRIPRLLEWRYLYIVFSFSIQPCCATQSKPYIGIPLSRHQYWLLSYSPPRISRILDKEAVPPED